MKKKTVGKLCPTCGAATTPKDIHCGGCGQHLVVASTPTTPSTPPSPIRNFFSAFFSILFTPLLVVSTTLVVLLVFLDALNANIRIPATGPFTSVQLEAFFKTNNPFFIAGALLAVILLLLLWVNWRYKRRFFFFTGLSTLITAALVCGLGFAIQYAIFLLPTKWQDALLYSTAVFQDFSCACAMALVFIGVTFLSIYACIVSGKGEQDEKTA